MATSSGALFITNALQNAKPIPADGVTAQATATSNAILANTTNSYNIFLEPISFIANNLINIMNYIATAALVIAGALFAFELLKMAIEYMINHEASKLTKTFVRKILLFLILGVVVTHLQQIMSFVFGSFVSFGQAVGGQLVSSMGNPNVEMGNPLFSWGQLGLIWMNTFNTITVMAKSWTNVGQVMGDYVLVYAILVIISLLVIFIIIQYFIIQLEIIIQMSLGAISLAFAMLSYTDYIPKNYVKSLINMGIRLFTIIVIIYFFNVTILYEAVVMGDIATNIGTVKNQFQILNIALLSLLFLSLLVAFFVAKGPSLVANSMNGSGEGSGMDAGMVMAGGAALAYGGVSLATGGLSAAASVAPSGLSAAASVAGGGISAGASGVSKITKMIKSEAAEHKKHTTINPTDFKQPTKTL
jgi:hypothetical protein